MSPNKAKGSFIDYHGPTNLEGEVPAVQDGQESKPLQKEIVALPGLSLSEHAALSIASSETS
jgi:hypothetical protein